MATAAVQARHWSRQEYERLVSAGMFHPEEQLELVQGEILQMSPQGSAHATAVSLVENALREAFGSNYLIRIQMPLALDPDSEPEPDIAVMIGSPRDYRNAHPKTAELVVEVADTTIEYDRKRKTPLYAKAGIQENWILNILERQLEVFSLPARDYSLSQPYQERKIHTPPETVSPLHLPEISILVADLLP